MKLAVVWLAVGIADLWWLNAALVPEALADGGARYSGEAEPPALASVAGSRPRPERARAPSVRNTESSPEQNPEQSRAEQSTNTPTQEEIGQQNKLEEHNVRAGTVEEDNVRADTVNESAREESAREESAHVQAAAAPPERPPILFASGQAEASGDDARAVQRLAAYLV
ncbi:MAG: hypothetical protein AAF721_32475, partial [Myxococcota bacterium]